MGLCSSSSAVTALAAADKEFVAKHIGAQQALLDALGLTYEDGAKLFEAFEAMDSSGAGSGSVDFHEFCVVSTHPRALDCALDCCSVTTTRASLIASSGLACMPSSVTSLRHSPHPFAPPLHSFVGLRPPHSLHSQAAHVTNSPFVKSWPRHPKL